MVPLTWPPTSSTDAPARKGISIMNYVIDLYGQEDRLFVRYANSDETGPSVSVWMVPV
jgi:hypothetical protein